MWKNVCFNFHVCRSTVCWSNGTLLSICSSSSNCCEPICAYCWSGLATRNTTNSKKTCVWSRSAKIEKSRCLPVGFKRQRHLKDGTEGNYRNEWGEIASSINKTEKQKKEERIHIRQDIFDVQEYQGKQIPEKNADHHQGGDNSEIEKRNRGIIV